MKARYNHVPTILTSLIALIVVMCLPTSLKSQPTRFLVGTTNGEVSASVAVCDLDEHQEALTIVTKLNAGKRPGYLVINDDYLYAVSTDLQGKDQNTLRAFALQNNGTDLKLLSEVSSKGINPCYVSINKSVPALFAANYSSGSVVQYQIRSDGSLGEPWYFQQFEGSSVNAKRQQGPHAHYIHPTVDNQFALTADLGTDKVMVHRLNQQGKMSVYEKQPYFELPAGSGPRHLEFHPNNQWVYVLNELNSTISTVKYQNGEFKVGKTISTLPQDFKDESSSAAVRIHPSGHYLYSSNRGSDSISVYAIDKQGDLTRIQTFGEGLGWVRDFNVTPSGKFIVAGNEKTDQVVLLKLKADGQIAHRISSVDVPSPSCFVFLN